MARTIVVQITCDLCGAEVDSDQSTEFGVGGSAYRSDLCNMHADELTKVLKPFIDVAENVTTRQPQVKAVRHVSFGKVRPRRDPEQVGAIRSWARANGYEVSSRGRIPAHVEDAYNRRGR
jgi:hypothetical protein